MSHRLHPTKNKGLPATGSRWWIITISQGKKGKQLNFTYYGTDADVLAEDKRLNGLLKGERTTVDCTIADKLPEYAIHYKTIATPAIVTDMLSVMRRCLLPAFGKLAPRQIVGPLISSYTLRRLEAGVTHRTIQKELNYLSAMLKWMKRNGFATELPEIIKPPQAKCAPQAIKQPLTLDELSAFLRQLPPDRQALAMLMSDAGLRMSEALNMRCEDVDLAGGRVTVRGKGNKQTQYPILTRRLLDALEREKRGRVSGWLVVNPSTTTQGPESAVPYQSLKTLFRLAAKRAGITKPITHHILRHTYSTLLMELEIPAEVRRQLMRHSTLAATEHYTHISPEWMEKQAGRFSSLIDNLGQAVEEIKAASVTLEVKKAKKRPDYLRLVK
jgi:integrase